MANFMRGVGIGLMLVTGIMTMALVTGVAYALISWMIGVFNG